MPLYTTLLLEAPKRLVGVGQAPLIVKTQAVVLLGAEQRMRYPPGVGQLLQVGSEYPYCVRACLPRREWVVGVTRRVQGNRWRGSIR